ncbi:DUF1127 domain-containing protein [Marinobacter halodurans]|uniref:DUF1127 domain-containing protein n=1 Tax=Marinobacter halodurans TaxID=2528979 RepID=A0ABY1ZJ98_9GAMM|nr:DUF1127 domain-containing protein [Marinobacter halodurans]TBW49243.1 DUF1127 domain-containing protein [Marinobacter halodurans]
MQSILTFKFRKFHWPAPRALTRLRRWKKRLATRHSQRREFGAASPEWLARMERDIGLEPGDLQRELNKPFWEE